jgi:hypothetical protein
VWSVRTFQKGETEALVANSTIYDPDWRDEDKKGDLISTTKLVSQEGEEEHKTLTTGAGIKITHLSTDRNMPSIMDPVRWRNWLPF